MTLISPWRIQLFGDLRVSREDQSVERFRRGTDAELLADLAMHAATSHPREELAERYWPDADLDAGRLNLRVALTSLRRRLEPPGTPRGSVLITDRSSVRLNSAVIRLDVNEFRAAVLAARGDPGRHVDRLEEAVRLYAGELLPGYRADWIEPERTALAEMFLEALGSLAQTLSEKGKVEDAIGYAARLAAADRSHEPGNLLLMRLYAQAGQTKRALNQYAKLQRVLRQEFQEPPSAEAQRLAKELRARPKRFCRLPLSAEAASRPDGSASSAISSASSAIGAVSSPEVTCSKEDGTADSKENGAAVTPAGATRENTLHLPHATTRFFGRDAELAGIQALFAQQGHRLVTLTGPGGIGKSRLAVESAARLHALDGAATWFIPLAEIDDANRLPQAILAALGRSTDAAPDPVQQVADALSLEALSLKALSLPTMRLVLDNFEQLVEQGAAFVLSLLERTPGLSCLVTSRRHLAVPGERVLEVSPLPLPGPRDTLQRLAGQPSVRLFVDRAQAKAPEFQVTERNREAISELVCGLEGIPLALEMAAVWVRVRTPAGMAAELEDRYELLTRNARGVPDRHTTLARAVAWSYDLLSPVARQFLGCLSAFRGGWTLEAAQAVWQEPGASSLLAELQEHSWITSAEEAAGMRFGMLKTLQEFAHQQMDAEARAELSRRHAECYQRFLDAAKYHFDGPEQHVWVSRTAADWDNLSAAVQWCLEDDAPERVLRLASDLCRFCEIRGYPGAGRSFLEAALQKPGDVSAAVLGPALNSAGWLAFVQGDYAAALPRFEGALAAATELADRKDEAIALGNLGLCHQAEARYEKAAACFGRSGGLAREIGAKLFEANARGNLANLLKSRGHYEEACAQYQECVGLFEALGNRRSEAIVWLNMGDAFCKAERFADGRGPLRRALGISHQLEDRWLLAVCFEGLGSVLADAGRVEEAVRLLGAAGRLRRETGIPVALADREAFERSVEIWRQELGTAAFQQLWLEGEEAPLEQAVRWALQETE